MVKRWNFLNGYNSYSISIVFIISFFILISIQNAEADHVRGTSPLILPLQNGPKKNFLASHKNENVTLKCLSDEPIVWRLSENQETFSHQITQFKSQNFYETHLELININHRFVGFYYCVKNSSLDSNLQTKFENHLASKIYVFVDDDLFPLYSLGYSVIEVTDKCDTVVPCKPTNTGTTVELYQIRSQDQGNRTFYKIDQTQEEYGFLVKNADLGVGENLFICSSNGVQNRITVYVDRTDLINYETLDESKYVNEPTISSKTDNFGIEGGNLELICTFNGLVDGSFSFDWKIPNNNQSRMSIQSEWGISNLTVKSLDAEKDIGTYECIVTSNGQKFVEKLTVTNILGVNDSFANIIAPSFTEAGRDGATFVAKFSGFPTPTLIWRDIHGKDILTMDDETPEYGYNGYVDRNERFTKLNVYNSVNDKLGYYTLYATNNQTQDEKQILLVDHVKKPELGITLDRNGNGIRAKCEVHGHPKSAISLEACFIDGDGNSDCKRIQEVNVTSNGADLQTSLHEIGLKKNLKVLNVTCIAKNVVEMNEITKTLIAPSDYTLYTNKDHEQSEANEPSGSIAIFGNARLSHLMATLMIYTIWSIL